MRKHIFFISFLTLFSSSIDAQISIGGEPLSIIEPALNIGVSTTVLSKPDVEALLLEDITRDANGSLLRDAVVVPMVGNLETVGTWFNLASGDRVWKHKIKVPDALSLEIYFDDFHMPPGSRLFVMNENMTESLGAFTSINNKLSNRFCTGLVKGEVVQLEYYEPIEALGIGRISILDVGYRYRDVIGFNDQDDSGTGECQVDMVCSEGDQWTDVARSVMRIRSRINGALYWSTGTLVNNGLLDCRPYVLTAMNSSLDNGFQSTQTDFDFFRFHFGREAFFCGSNDRQPDKSIVGCNKVGNSNDSGGNTGSDFLLVQISVVVPNSFNVYYAGWNAEDIVTSGGGVSIHYPFGETKKVSTYEIDPITSGWIAFDTHWRVQWESTPNGHGVMELGSTGAPLFDSAGRVIGTYTGGSSNCTSLNQPDFFGKMSWHWTENPNPPFEKLNSILDSGSLGLLSQNGDSSPCTPDGLDEIELANRDLFPNPTAGVFEIQQDTQDLRPQMLIVTTLLGEVVKRFPKAHQVRYDLSEFINGVYLVTIIYDESTSVTKKLILSK